MEDRPILPNGNDQAAYRAWYAEKRKADNRYRTRRYRARRASLDGQVEDGSASTAGDVLHLQTGRVRAARLSQDLGKEIAEIASSRLNQYDSSIQCSSIEKFLTHSSMRDIVPPYLRNLDTVKLQDSVLSSVREGIREHLVGVKQSKIVMAKDILCTFASTSNTGSGRGLAGLLGVDRRNITKARGRRVVLDAGKDAFWLHQRRKVRSDALTDDVKATVERWWEEETTVSPNMKDIVSFHEGLRQWLSHPTHFLQCSQLEFYMRFKAKHSDLVCSLSSFESLKPWWVKRLKIWNTCCCRYHQELSELKNALDIMRTSKEGVHFNCYCNCAFVCDSGSEHTSSNCSADNHVYERLTNLWSSILCQNNELTIWHRRECLLGSCADCGVKLLRLCPLELTSDKLVSWKSIGYKVIGSTEEGVPRKATTLEYKETTPRELIEYLKPKLQSFVLHNYVATWQDFQFRELFSSVPPRTLISCIDFSENYTLKVQNEIQSMHWHNDQVTILVHITYRLNPQWTMENDEPLLLKEIHYYVSDDKTHDSLYVQHCLMLNWDHAVRGGFYANNHIVWSDGCSGQFKSARAWYFISRYPNLTVCDVLREGCQMSWNYFASGHGKGEVDGAGALLKREIRAEQLKPDGAKLQNATEIVEFLKNKSDTAHAGPAGARCRGNKFFWLIPQVGPGSAERSDSKQAERVPGSMSNHQCRSVSARDPTLIQFRHLTCFCHACFTYGCGQACFQSDHVPDFTLYRLNPRAPCQTRRLYDAEEEVEAGTSGEWIADGLSVGDNVAVRAPLEEEPFWLMIVATPTHTVEDAFTDRDGNGYVPGDVVFSGFWYERLREGSRTYLLRNDREPSTVYSHLVLTSKFSLPPIAHPLKSRCAGYELRVDVKEIIEDALRAAILLD